MEQYDLISERFVQLKLTAAYPAADTFTLLREVGRVPGAAALDVACGFGFNTRLLAGLGAYPVVGVDISPEMVRLAREHEEHQPLGLSYRVADAANLPVIGAFDLATAVYLFNYAATGDALRAMFARIHANLKPGGRLVALVPNPSPYPHGNWDPYGFHVHERIAGGDVPLLKGEFLSDPAAPLEFYEWQLADLAAAAADCGFTSVRTRPVTPPPPTATRDAAFWQGYVDNPVSSMLTCTAD
ncbi:class I SAM-dependent methyltransferase [Kitasatospora sp. LaBMicrA B282]|uniref:class I SAM-dependent methyltransferase n=1 Tax=Kitasatospora sp. LaBMicrA B282 TaxID=3420949 RepID=UPI003D0F78C5